MEQKCNSISRYKSESNDSSKNVRPTSQQTLFVQQQSNQSTPNLINNHQQITRMESNPSSPNTTACTTFSPSSANTQKSDSHCDLVKFKWVCPDESTFPELSIPCLFRSSNNNNYFCVRIIEQVLLSKFENMISDELKQFGNLNAYHCELNEINTLNEINDNHMNKEYGQEPFGTNDRLVECEHFYKFYEILKRTCRLKAGVIPAGSNSTRNRNPTRSQITVTLNNRGITQSNQPAHNAHVQSSSMYNQTNLPFNQMLNSLPVDQVSIINSSSPVYSTNVRPIMMPQTRASLTNPNSISLIRPPMPRVVQRHPSPQAILHQAHIPSNQNFMPSQTLSISTRVNPCNNGNSLGHVSFQTSPIPINMNSPVYSPNQNANPTLVSVNNDFLIITNKDRFCAERQNIPKRQLSNMRRSSASSVDSERNLSNNFQYSNRNVASNQLTRLAFYNQSNQSISSNRETIRSASSDKINQARSPTQAGNYQQLFVQQTNRPENQLTNQTPEQQVYEMNDDVSEQGFQKKRQLEHEKHQDPSYSSQAISTQVSNIHHINDNLSINNADSIRINNVNSYSPSSQQIQQIDVETQVKRPHQKAIDHQQASQHVIKSDSSIELNNDLNTVSKNSAIRDNVNLATDTAASQLLVINDQTLTHESQAIISEPMTPDLPSLLPDTNGTNEQLQTQNVENASNNMIVENICNNLNSQQAMIFAMIDNNNNTNNSNNSFSENSSFTTLTTFSDVSSSINQSQVLNRPKKDVLFTSTSHKTQFGYLQINNSIIPYICILDSGFKCLPKYPSSVKYVSLKHLVYMGYVDNALYMDKKMLKERFSTYYIADMNQLSQFDSLYEQLNDVLSDTDFKFDFHAEYGITSNNLHELFELINLSEFICFYNLKPIYVQLISNAGLIGIKKMQEYAEVLEYSGGLVQLDAAKNKPEKRIVPFLDMHGEMILVPYANVSYLLKGDPDFDTNVVEFKSEGESKKVNRFLQLMLFFICVDVDMKSVRFVNIKPWFTKSPDMFFKLCVFDSDFPTQWNCTFSVSNKMLNSLIAQYQQQQQQQKQLHAQQLRQTTYILPPSIHLNQNDMQSVTLSPLSIDSSSPSPALANGLFTNQPSNILYQIIEQPVSFQQSDELRQQQTSYDTHLNAPSPGLMNLEAQLFSPASLLTSLQPQQTNKEPNDSDHISLLSKMPQTTSNSLFETRSDPVFEPQSHSLFEAPSDPRIEAPNDSDQISLVSKVPQSTSNSLFEMQYNQPSASQQLEVIVNPNLLDARPLVSSVEISTTPAPSTIVIENSENSCDEQTQTVASSNQPASLNIEKIPFSESIEKKSETACKDREQINELLNRQVREDFDGNSVEFDSNSKRKRRFSDSVLCVQADIEVFLSHSKTANGKSSQSDEEIVNLEKSRIESREEESTNPDTINDDPSSVDTNVFYDIIQAETPREQTEQVLTPNERVEPQLQSVEKASVSCARKAFTNESTAESKIVTTINKPQLDSLKESKKISANDGNQSITKFLKPNSNSNLSQAISAQHEQKAKKRKSSSIGTVKVNASNTSNNKPNKTSKLEFDKSIYSADSDKSKIVSSEEEKRKSGSTSSNSSSDAGIDENKSNKKRKRRKGTFGKKKRIKRISVSKKPSVSTKNKTSNHENQKLTYEICKQLFNLKTFKICIKSMKMEEIESYKKSSIKIDQKALSKSTVSKSEINTVSSGASQKTSVTSLFAPNTNEKTEPVKPSHSKQTVDKKIDKKSKTRLESDDSDLPDIEWC
jgi:hypothetical protein